ncbi:NADH dehydrogenase (ubiquinone) flavoprotein 2, putative [Cyanobium sp. PCC 7001]|uniref:NADH-quinone oxidoreductase subunit NuoE family protein n=1 Tax=Cyanobium sp. PCC 7001 TaxID=180281 RepID=UPI0001805061|nr:NAD(P)H-dependent oxidoreductase subunit E [Cyanobium sp. PCC 7001]EDY38448.1 NADH dehydrogenase (ubiquinone) flavoprotein 2, putative [Cyanobium sp. PCC 7001]
MPAPPTLAELPPQAVERTTRLIRQQRGRADALIEVLHQVQELYGYLPPGALEQVARELKLPLARVHGVASFYHLFRLEAPTAHRCAVCLGTACFVKGGGELAARLEQRLGLQLDDPAGNGNWALEHVSCLGACGQAPVLVVDGQMEPRLPMDDPAALDGRLAALGLTASAEAGSGGGV